MKENFKDSNYFINRELSWLEFNQRVLEEAEDQENPLMERMRFLSIASSNLDEFFMVRVASLKDQVNAGFEKLDASGRTPKKQLRLISQKTQKIVRNKYTIYHDILDKLKDECLVIRPSDQLSIKQESFLEKYFNDIIYPVLTPMAVEKSRSFPIILNKSLNIGMMIEDLKCTKEPIFATVQVPAVLPRLIEIPSESSNKCFIFLEEVIRLYIDRLFLGHRVTTPFPYRITRNADLSIEEEEAEDLLIEIEKSLIKRKTGATIRLEVDKRMPEGITQILEQALHIHKGEVYRIDGPIDLTFLNKIYELDGYDYLKFEKYEPKIPQELLASKDIFGAISKKDIVLLHPFESFDPVVEFVRKASEDPAVLAIKQTLYRVSGDSPIIKALEIAASKGKQVTVLVEVKARFDEENNIQWAKRLERAGCHVVYGLVGLKTHCKVTLVVRMEGQNIKRYIHLGTGNYNDITAKVYTDFSLFTSNIDFGQDATSLFNMLTGHSQLPPMNKFYIAPINMRAQFKKIINNERKNAKNGKEARIVAKMNSLVDSEIIVELFKASKAGVKIDLIVRGICCLRPGVPGISENITVRSIVGRYLEHTRVFYFLNGGNEAVYLSSADWMPRNLNRRVELLFEVEEPEAKNKILEIIQFTLMDTAKTRVLNSECEYQKISEGSGESFNSQCYFMQLFTHKTDH
ncbi:RNA degradosome polyphosphate kinase [Serpentinicella sp. ANB-PHB4]|uniref:RNA degradosome polyphosphate kinase n=1 Tax=Serpentinicella sp. ANB-PHB4 TaxID=3074076 RepID=UPI0028566BEC|nr:RNA degradosome polyphosphate kinase [Serpentinicella sp. ANB-PHB4]MDR5659094.1 RNA degradosome polyphosphate kinase [Serpentinicella sp. ANB-PHB4]